MFERCLVSLVLRVREDHIANGRERTFMHLWNFELALETFIQYVSLVEDDQLVEAFPGTCSDIKMPTLHSGILA
jgi:hypothetical protein